MRRYWGIFVVLLLSWAFALQTGRALAYSLAYLVTAVIVLSFLWAWANITWVQFARFTRGRRSQVGKLAEEQFELHNRSILPKLWVEVRDYSTMPGHFASRVLSTVGPRKRQRWMVRTYCEQRGRFRLGPMTLASGDPLGLFRLRRELPATSTMIVYPATVDIPGFEPSTGYMQGGEALWRRTHQITTNVSGVRGYAPGDSFSRIHWRSTARTGELMVKEFELDPTADVWVILDMNTSMHYSAPWEPAIGREGPAVLWKDNKELQLRPSTEEYAVTAAASLARHFLMRQRAVGLISHARRRELIQADRGERQLNKILETMAVIEATGYVPFDQVLASEGKQLSRNTTLIAITPSTSLDWVASLRDLRRRGVHGIAILLAADTFVEADSWRPVHADLIASGISTYLVRRDVPLAASLTHRSALGAD